MTAERTLNRGSVHSPVESTLRESIDRIPDVDEPGVERREAEAQDVGRAEVADHTAGDQGLHDRVSTSRVRNAHLTAPLVRVPRAHERECVSGAARFDQLDTKIRERNRLLSNRREAAVCLGRENRVHPTLERSERENRRRPADEPRHAISGSIVRGELERRSVTEPSGEWLAPLLPVHPFDVPGMRPCKCGRAGAAVQVLVAAPNREVRPHRRCDPPACRLMGIAPAECARSQIMSAPTACAARVTSSIRCIRPVR